MLTGGILGYTSGRYENGTFIIDAPSREMGVDPTPSKPLKPKHNFEDTEEFRKAMAKFDKLNIKDLKVANDFTLRWTPGLKGTVYRNFTPDPNEINNDYMRPDFPQVVVGYNPNGSAITQKERSYMPNEYIAQNNKYLFSVSTDFIKKAAEKYALLEGDQYYTKPPIFDYNFVDAVNGFFYDGKASYHDMDPLRMELQTAAREMAQNIKNGGSTDVRDLKSTITIHGEKITFAKFKEMQAKSLEIESGATLNCGTDNVLFFAKDGLTKALGVQYGKSLGGKLGEVYADKFAKGVDDTYQRMVHDSKTGEGGDKKYMILPTEYGMKAFDLFEKVGIDYDFSTAIKKFDSLVDEYNKVWGMSDDTRSYCKNELTKLYNKALK